MKYSIKLLSAVISMAVSGSLLAAVSPEEAKQIGTTLTPWGAEIAGNADGSIPAYTGGIKPPASYDPSKPGIRPDPFADEKPMLVITAANMTQHADKLTEGTKAMLAKYPETFRIDIYSTHRTARYPDFYLQNSKKNATECQLTPEGLSVSNCWAGAPFPIPKTGQEVMWNRVFKFEQAAFRADDLMGTVVDANGTVIHTAGWKQWNQYPLWISKQNEKLAGDEINEMMRADYDAPGRKAGEKLVLHDGINMLTNARRAWSYVVGQRRVKLSPDVAYDTPSPTGAGIGTVDDSMVFYGALDRYDFTLVGKKEMYIPYNMFKIQDQTKCGKDVVYTPNFLNPDCMRWELHRVWVVDAKLKSGKRHTYPTRTFYWDEDYLGVGMADSYDSTGKIYRVVQSESFPFYESTGHSSSQFAIYDLISGAYTRQAYSTGKTGWYTIDPVPLTMFSPQALSAGGVR